MMTYCYDCGTLINRGHHICRRCTERSLKPKIIRKEKVMKKEAARFNEGKPKLGYFRRSFHKVLEGVARVKEFGATKYTDGNWRLGNKPDSEYLDSFERHMSAFLQGEFYDTESGCAHISHMVWNLSALYELNYPDKPVIDEEIFWTQMKFWQEK